MQLTCWRSGPRSQPYQCLLGPMGRSR